MNRSLISLVLPAIAWCQFAQGDNTSSGAVLSSSGAVYSTRTGVCRDLFPQCGSGAELLPVLAVDVKRPDEPNQRLLVGGTLGPEVEGKSVVVFEDSSNSLYVVWESHLGADNSRINLAWLQEGEWSEVVEVSGNPDSTKGSPQILITRDSFQLAGGASGETVSHQRAVVHVVWWEEGPQFEEVYYTPIFLVDGSFVGRNEVYNLTALDTGEAPETPVSPLPSLLQAPQIEQGRDSRSVVIGFVSPVSHRFLTFESRLLPAELSWLGDQLETEMIQQVALCQGGLTHFAERIRTQLIEFGSRFQPSHLSSLASLVKTEILAAELSECQSAVVHFAERIRGQTIEFGVRTTANDGLLETQDSAEPGQLMETHAATFVPGSTPTSHALWLKVVAQSPAPDSAGGGAPVRFFLSPDGKTAVISWKQDGGLSYRESSALGWSPTRQIEITDSLDLNRAEQILRRRVGER